MAANEAEVDLVVNAAGALPDLERQLNQIIRLAEDGADAIDVDASLGVQETIRTLSTQLERAIDNVDRSNPTIDVDIAVDTVRSLQRLRADVEGLTETANRTGENVIDLIAEFEIEDSLRNVTSGVQTIVSDAEQVARAIQIEAELNAESVRALEADLAAEERRLQAELDDFDARIQVEVDIENLNAERLRQFRESLENLDGSSRRLGDDFRTLTRSTGLFTAGVGGASVVAGGLANTLVAVATAVEQVGPAAAVATSGILTVQLAANTLKLAMIGVEDAIKKAFDPDVKPEELEKALKGLAPEARKFVVELRSMSGELSKVQQGVQNRVFRDFDEILKNLATDLGPTVTASLNRAADSLNAMGRNAATAASQLGKQGVLGQALEGANDALTTLEKVPARAVRSFGFLAAAAAPGLNRIAVAVDDVSLKIATKLQRAFESGALEKSIDQAISTLAQFGRSLGNFGAGFRNIFQGLTQNGRGLFDILENISQAFEDVTATKGFQDALKAVASVADTFTTTVLPLLSQALQALGPIFTALGPPIETLIKALGGALGDILAALAPVLAAAAKAVGALVVALSPLLTLVGDLIAALLPAITPVFDAFAKVFEVISPFVQAVAETLSSLLVPVLEQLGPIVQALLIPFVTLYQTVFPKLTEIVIALQPTFERLGEALGRVTELLGPIIQRIVELGIEILGNLLPSIQPLIDVLVFLAENALKGVALVLEEFVIPALQVVTKFLNGDFVGAVHQSHQIVAGFKLAVAQAFADLANTVAASLGRMVLSVVGKVTELRNQFVAGVVSLINDVVSKFQALPGQIVAAVGNLSNVLFSAGVNLISGLAAGIQSRVGGLLSEARSIANSIVSTIEGALDIHSPSRRTKKTGRFIVQGLEEGMREQLASLKRVANDVATVALGDLGKIAAKRTAIGNGTANLPTITGAGTNVVNVYIGNQLIQQFINDNLRAALTQRDRAFAQGVRL